ncbi:hypothetical protein Syun_021238 [Stephania yunnanensis]|uniref:Uncharacterized protein n=1 Tax=Stephania yunnanensis TaxID=152371 RepID=A0AAP0IFC1_9MAGN
MVQGPKWPLLTGLAAVDQSRGRFRPSRMGQGPIWPLVQTMGRQSPSDRSAKERDNPPLWLPTEIGAEYRPVLGAFPVAPTREGTIPLFHFVGGGNLVASLP